MTLVGGSIPERSAGKLYNTCCVFGPDGKLLAKHRKVRLHQLPGLMPELTNATPASGKEPRVGFRRFGQVQAHRQADDDVLPQCCWK